MWVVLWQLFLIFTVYKFVARQDLWMSLKLCQLVHSPPNTRHVRRSLLQSYLWKEWKNFLYNCHVFPQSRGLDNWFPVSLFSPSLNYLDLFSHFVPLWKEPGEQFEVMTALTQSFAVLGHQPVTSLNLPLLFLWVTKERSSKFIRTNIVKIV